MKSNASSLPPLRQDFYPLAGGLDLVSPAITIDPGKVIDSQNYEPAIAGGYRRIDGYERFDGRASPTTASYWVLPTSIIASIAVGSALIGNASSATGIVLFVSTSYVVLARISGTFVTDEAVRVGSSVVGIVSGLALQNGALMPSDHADYALLAANDQRTLISVVPGSGPIRGVWVYNDTVYAFRDNNGGTAGQMWKATSGGWVQVTFGSEISFGALTGPTATVTITIASPAVVTWAGHPFVNGQPVVLSTTGALPSGLSAGVTYYVVSSAANQFSLAATPSGTPITTTGTQSGTHTGMAQGASIAAGATVIGLTSGATAVVGAALLRTGTWTAAPVGTLVLTGITGTFVSGEALRVSGIYVARTTSVATAITRAPGGRLEFFNYNFTGSTNSTKIYGVDGVNLAFEFDGTTYVPIRTGMASDKPSHVMAHKGYLFLSFLASVQYSALGNPYAWTVVLGAGEIDCSSNVTGFLPQAGNGSGSSLAIFTAERTFILYGSGSADFNLVSSIFDMGYVAFTAQQVSNDAYGMTSRGIQALLTTLNYGDFDYSSISHMVQPLITKKRGLESASTTLRTKNQYRVFFSDGTVLAVGLTGDKVSGILPLNYGRPVRCICSATLTTGLEVCYFGSDDGYVFNDNIGTSQDGAPIEAWLRLPFNNDKSPRIRKRFRRAITEVVAEGYGQVNVSYDFGYANPDVRPSAPQPDNTLVGSGGYWDQFTWDQFTWDAPFVADISTAIDGCETNISVLYYSNRAQDAAHTFSGITLISTPRRLSRA